MADNGGKLQQGQHRKPITEETGVKLREEAFERGTTRPRTWRNLVDGWRGWVARKQSEKIEFQDDEGNVVRGGTTNRFQPAYREKQYAKFNDLERGVKRDYENLHTAILTFTASNRDEDRNLIPPVDHLAELLSSWGSVRREIHRSLEDRYWEYLAVLEPHKSGYAHLHVAVFDWSYPSGILLRRP
jgi:hypothetical protein